MPTSSPNYRRACGALSGQWNLICSQNTQTEGILEIPALTYTTPTATAPGPLLQS